MRIKDLVNICDIRTSDGDYINNKCDLTCTTGFQSEFQVKERQQSRLMVNHMADPAATQSLVII
jgi:hypothetical protein